MQVQQQIKISSKRMLPHHQRRLTKTPLYLWPILSMCLLHLPMPLDLWLWINKRLNEILKTQHTGLQWYHKVQAVYLVQLFQINQLKQSKWKSFRIMCKESIGRIRSRRSKKLIEDQKSSKEYSQSQKNHPNQKQTLVPTSSSNHQPLIQCKQRRITHRCTDLPLVVIATSLRHASMPSKHRPETWRNTLALKRRLNNMKTQRMAFSKWSSLSRWMRASVKNSRRCSIRRLCLIRTWQLVCPY